MISKITYLFPKSLGFRLISTILVGLFVITGYFIYTTYNIYLEQSEERILDKLHYISKNIALQIDGDIHQKLSNTLTEKTPISEIQSNSDYIKLHNILKKVQSENKIETDIYTLFKGPKLTPTKPHVCFAITSGPTPYYGADYSTHPKELLDQFKTGGKLHPYGDENGTWLSAFYPIKSSKNEVVAVVQVDEKFDTFISNAKTIAIKEIIYSLITFVLISIIIILIMRSIIRIELMSKRKLRLAYHEVQKKNKEKKLLLQEIHHRVKNNLQIVSSLLSIHSTKTEDENSSKLFHELQQKISTMSLVHEKLYKSENIATLNLGNYIKELAESIISSNDVAEKIELKIDFEQINVGVKKSTPIGLMLSEILINAIKHAFTGLVKGKITIQLSSNENNIVLTIGDNGVGINKPPRNGSLGLELIDSFITQLNGAIEKLEGQGTTYQITLPKE